jgi:hypothetical protein
VSWFSKRRAPRPEPQTPEPETVRLRSLALGNLFSDLVPGGAYRFLDLGTAVGRNIEFLSRYALSVQVGDFWATASQPGASSLERALEPLTPPAETAGFHVVLAWDLLNYLDREQLARTARHLGSVTRPGGYLFALVYYAAEMPAEPLRYRIVDRETLVYPRPAASRPSPRYPQGAVEQAFAAFELEHAYLLKTGLQEYLFVRKA